jgi:hypothetical protein
MSESELAHARLLAADDERLADALRCSGSHGFGEYLGIGPQLYCLWQDAWMRGSWVQAPFCGIGLLRLTIPDHHDVFGYLVDEQRRRGGGLAPESVA